MFGHDATEVAFKNGEEKGRKDVLEMLKRLIKEESMKVLDEKSKLINVVKVRKLSGLIKNFEGRV